MLIVWQRCPATRFQALRFRGWAWLRHLNDFYSLRRGERSSKSPRGGILMRRRKAGLLIFNRTDHRIIKPRAMITGPKSGVDQGTPISKSVPAQGVDRGNTNRW